MNLICMAHRGEAQAFIQGLNLSKTSDFVFENDETLLLLTGEGPFEAATRVAYLLGQRHISAITNLGICGSLKSDLALESIHEVRQSYLLLQTPQFKSFPLGNTGLDCITSFERVLKRPEAEKLRGVAPLVDRELWGIALSAKEAKVPLRSFKLISDLVGETAICDIALEKSLGWSMKLFEHYSERQWPSQKKTDDLHLEGFYFTFTSEHQLRTLLSKTRLSPEDLPLDDLRSASKNPKERAKLLVQHLEEKLDPLKSSLRQRITAWKSPFEEKSIRIETDPYWEDPKVKISFEIESDHDLHQRLTTLKDLKLSFYTDLLDGKLHVE